MNKQQQIEELAKKIYDGVWFESDPNPGMDNWKCCINEATIAIEFMEKRYAPLVEAAIEILKIEDEEKRTLVVAIMNDTYTPQSTASLVSKAISKMAFVVDKALKALEVE